MKKNRKRHVVIMIMISLLCLVFTTGCSTCKSCGKNCGKCSENAFIYGCVGCMACVHCGGATEGCLDSCSASSDS